LLPRRFLLPVQQVLQALAELRVFAVFRQPFDGGKFETEPFGLFGLLYKQFGYACRGHSHLPLSWTPCGGLLTVAGFPSGVAA